MHFQTKIAQADFFKAAIDDIECSRFFRNKENCLFFRQALRNHIGNGLAFSCTWRADEHKILTLGCAEYGSHLRGVCQQGAMNILGE